MTGFGTTESMKPRKLNCAFCSKEVGDNEEEKFQDAFNHWYPACDHCRALANMIMLRESRMQPVVKK